MSRAEANAAAMEAGTIPPPPFDGNAEQTLLAAVLSDPRCFAEAAEMVTPDMFGDERHATMWAAMLTLDARGQAPTPQAVAGAFQKPEDRVYPSNLAAVGLPFSLDSYARTVRDIWMRREIHRVGLEAAYMAAYPNGPQAGAAIVETLDARLFEIGGAQSAEVKPTSLADAGRLMLENYAAAHRNGGRVGTPTGFAKIDDMLGGLEAGSLTICGARPSMGKTALAVGMAERMARGGARVLFFQLEMSAPQIARRMAASAAGIDVSEIKRTRLDDAAFRRMVEALRELEGLPIDIVDRPGVTAAQIRSIARRQKRRSGLDVLIVDHLTLMGWPADAKGQSPTWAIGQNSGALKRLAKELGIAVLCLCQLSRANEGRENVRPQLSDLRWSGEIEQDADTVFFVHRESYYLERARPSRKSGETTEELGKRLAAWGEALENAKGRAEIVVAKQRDGAVGVVEIGFESATTRFHDLDTLPPYVDQPQGSLLEGGA
jgi:replicative DNA helicase